MFIYSQTTCPLRERYGNDKFHNHHPTMTSSTTATTTFTWPRHRQRLRPTIQIPPLIKYLHRRLINVRPQNTPVLADMKVIGITTKSKPLDLSKRSCLSPLQATLFQQQHSSARKCTSSFSYPLTVLSPNPRQAKAPRMLYLCFILARYHHGDRATAEPLTIRTRPLDLLSQDRNRQSPQQPQPSTVTFNTAKCVPPLPKHHLKSYHHLLLPLGPITITRTQRTILLSPAD
jgi:hypothetical protein